MQRRRARADARMIIYRANACIVTRPGKLVTLLPTDDETRTCGIESGLHGACEAEVVGGALESVRSVRTEIVRIPVKVPVGAVELRVARFMAH